MDSFGFRTLGKRVVDFHVKILRQNEEAQGTLEGNLFPSNDAAKERRNPRNHKKPVKGTWDQDVANEGRSSKDP